MKRVIFIIFCLFMIPILFTEAEAKDKKITKLYNAIRKGKTEAVKKLLDEGVDVNSNIETGWTPLYEATSYGNTEIVRLLLDRGADANAKAPSTGYTVLMQGVNLNGNLEIARMLLEKGADVNARNSSNGTTALIVSSNYSSPEITKLLLEKGADVNAKMISDGTTALMDGVRSSNAETVKLLLDKGADVNAKDKKGWTALMYASIAGLDSIVGLLLDKGADVNAMKNPEDQSDQGILTSNGQINEYVYGSTALMMASQFNHLEVARLLLGRGANVNIQATAIVSIPYIVFTYSREDNIPPPEFNGDTKIHVAGLTALYLAKEKGNADIVRLLENAGAVETSPQYLNFLNYRYSSYRFTFYPSFSGIRYKIK
jgi:ankyrin repeat protein